MAANEHKNLLDANRHNPKGFEGASNDTLLSKDIGSDGGGTDGDLVWVEKNLIKTTVVSIRGFALASVIDTNYWFPADVGDTKSPFEIDEDYGSATISASDTITVSKVIRSGSYVAQDACTVTKITGWMSGGATETVTLAIVKLTPIANDSTQLVPVAIDEIAVSTYGSNNKVGSFAETTITSASVAAGDILMPMVKSAGGANDIYFNLTIELGYDN